MLTVDNKQEDTVDERPGPYPVNQNALRRLKNIEGQVKGIRRMLEEEKYGVDILTQISAARAALNGVGMLILRRHIATCVSGVITAGGEDRVQIIDELMDVLTKQKI